MKKILGLPPFGRLATLKQGFINLIVIFPHSFLKNYQVRLSYFIAGI